MNIGTSLEGILLSAQTWDASNGISGAASNGFSNITGAVQNTGNGVIYIMMMLVGFVGVVGLMIAVLKIMVGGAGTKSEAKGSLFWIIVAAIIGFGAMGIIGMLQTVGLNLFN